MNPLSNFYKCTVSYGDLNYKSSEHFYKHEFCNSMNHHDVAQEVYDAPPGGLRCTPKEAKMIASRLKIADNSVQLAEWDKIKVSVMDFILRVKWNCFSKFRQSLLSTELGMVVAEATSCGFWGVGVAPNLALHTKP